MKECVAPRSEAIKVTWAIVRAIADATDPHNQNLGDIERAVLPFIEELVHQRDAALGDDAPHGFKYTFEDAGVCGGYGGTMPSFLKSLSVYRRAQEGGPNG